MTLYQNLLRSVYALDGIDGEFLGALAAPIVVDRERGSWDRPVTLAVIPSLRVRRLRINLSTAKGSLTRYQRRFLKLVEAGRVNDCGGWDAEAPYSSRGALGVVEGLREEVTEAATALAKILA